MPPMFSTMQFFFGRCLLCRLPVEEGDIVITQYRGETSPPFTWCTDDRIQVGKTYLECVPEDDRGDSYRPDRYANHEECVRLAGGSVPSLAMSSMSYLQKSTRRHDTQRIHRALAFLCRRLPSCMPEAGLPPEIWREIAGYLVPLCLVAETLTVCDSLATRQPDHAVSLDKPIWASYLYLDGVRYLYKLTNAARSNPRRRDRDMVTKMDNHVLLYDPQDNSEASRCKIIYVMEDRLGIRQLVFRRSTDASALPAVEEGTNMDDLTSPTWWHGQLIGTADVKLSVKSDGLKARSIALDRSIKPFEKHHWTAPMTPAMFKQLDMRIVTLRRDLEPRFCPFMQSFVCNAPETTGLSLFHSPNYEILHAHQQHEGLSFYSRLDEDTGNEGYWIYFPFADNEYISHLLINRLYVMGQAMSHWRAGQDARVAFQTNKGRNMFLSSVGPGRGGPSLSCLGSLPPGKTPTRVYYGAARNMFQVFGLTKTQKKAPKAMTAAPVAGWSDIGRRRTHFYSSADLGGVSKITMYRSRLRQEEFTGMTLEYSNGNPIVCLGSCRLDMAADPISVSSTTPMHLAFKPNNEEDVLPYICAVKVGALPEKRGLFWMEIPWSGKLQWWFSSEGSFLSHSNGRGEVTSSPEKL